MAKTIIQDFTLNQLHYNWGNSVTANIAPLFYPIRIIGSLKPSEKDITKALVMVHEPNGNTRTFEIPFTVFNKKEVFQNEFFKNMVFFNLNYVSHLQRYLMEECREVQQNNATQMLTKELGWQNFENVNDRMFVLESTVINNTTIKYYDESLKFQNGTYERQLKFIKDEILPYPETRLAMVLGLSSIVAGYVEPYLSVRNISN